MAQAPKVVVIGAGIVGVSVAYFLARAGIRAVLIDSSSPSAGATGSSDGAISVASKQPGMLMAFAQQARGLYARLSDEGVLAGLYQRRPTYLIARSTEEMALLELHASDLRSAGEAIEVADRAGLVGQIPDLGECVHGGVIVQNDGHALGYQITERLLRLAELDVLRNCACQRLIQVENKVTGIVTSQGEIAADFVVVAAGLESGRLCGFTKAIFPRKGQIIITDSARPGEVAFNGQVMAATYIAAKRRGAKAPPSPIGLVIDPLLTGQFLIGGTREDNRVDTGTDVGAISAILREAIELYPPLMTRRVIRTFSGVRSASHDGIPIVGFHPEVDNLLIATGFEGDGICLGPLTGSIVADLLLGRDHEVDIAAFDPTRLAPSGVAA
ncbi:FAD-binding oxidoreductase [Mesorhizobium sp. 1M-11]|uniref:NAD(P)/FAD-dependent oxidoreductase n=1 Tax=Mesorhizobium sp. 1M-11 TaxID=1529006 RepID=UPI0006C75903|nr:FAD-binding oxidoreductase [Mesorhizobium sp. 1M-11]